MRAERWGSGKAAHLAAKKAASKVVHWAGLTAARLAWSLADHLVAPKADSMVAHWGNGTAERKAERTVERSARM